MHCCVFRLFFGLMCFYYFPFHKKVVSSDMCKHIIYISSYLSYIFFIINVFGTWLHTYIKSTTLEKRFCSHPYACPKSVPLIRDKKYQKIKLMFMHLDISELKWRNDSWMFSSALINNMIYKLCNFCLYC